MLGASPPNSESGHRYAAEPLSNLNNVPPHLHNSHFPPPQYPLPWQPTTINDSNRWNQSPQGIFPSTLVGPGLIPTGNSGKRKRATPLGGASSVGGFGPLPPNNTVAEGNPSPGWPPPLFNLHGRRNAASDVWAFAHPLTSINPPPENQQLMPLEPRDANKPKTPWFGCMLCFKFGCVICPMADRGIGLILLFQGQVRIKAMEDIPK